MNISQNRRRILLGIVVICAMLPLLGLAKQSEPSAVQAAVQLATTVPTVPTVPPAPPTVPTVPPAPPTEPPASPSPTDHNGGGGGGKPTATKTPTATPVVQQNGPLPEQSDGGLHTGNYCVEAGGVGLYAVAAGDFTLDVPGQPVAAYVYWSARYPGPNEGDAQVKISLNGGAPIDIAAVESIVSFQGKTSTIYKHYYTYRSADVKALLADVTPGQITVRASDLKPGEAHGVSMVVIYEDVANCPLSTVNLHFGLDSLRYGFSHPYGPNTDVTCVDFAAASTERYLDTWLLVGGVESYLRKNAIWAAVGSGPQPTELIANGAGFIWDGPSATSGFPLNGNAGNTGGQLDVYHNALRIPAGATYACIQIESLRDDMYPDTGISAVWYGLAAKMPQEPLAHTPTPNPTHTVAPPPPTPAPPTAMPTNTPVTTPISVGTLPPLETNTPTATPTGFANLEGFDLQMSVNPTQLNWPQEQMLTFQIQYANNSGHDLPEIELLLSLPPGAGDFVETLTGLENAGWSCAVADANQEYVCRTTLGAVSNSQRDSRLLYVNIGAQLPESLTSLDVQLQVALDGVVQPAPVVAINIPIERTTVDTDAEPHYYMPIVVK